MKQTFTVRIEHDGPELLSKDDIKHALEQLDPGDDDAGVSVEVESELRS